MPWMLHHINLPALSVRETRAFLRNVIGLAEGRWIYPDRPGRTASRPRTASPISARRTAACMWCARCRASPATTASCTTRRSAAISPSRCRIWTPSSNRLDAAGIQYSDAGVYAMNGVRQIYVYDPSFNVIEINQTVAPLPADGLAEQDPAAEIRLRHAAIPAQDVDASTAFFQGLIGGDAPRVDSESAVFRSGDHAIRLTRLTSGYINGGKTDPASREPYFTPRRPRSERGPSPAESRCDPEQRRGQGADRRPGQPLRSRTVHAPDGGGRRLSTPPDDRIS